MKYPKKILAQLDDDALCILYAANKICTSDGYFEEEALLKAIAWNEWHRLDREEYIAFLSNGDAEQGDEICH